MASRVKLDQESLGLSLLVERIAKVQVKDCFKDDNNEMIYVIVNQGELGKAIGKGGENIHRIQQELGKRVKMIEYKDNVSDFVRGFAYPLQVKEVVQEGNVVIIKDDDRKTKSLLIGRDAKNLKLLNRAVKRFFNVEEVKVV
jgi:N utilization substance protein A